MSLEQLFNQVDALNNDDFEALINHVDRQKKKRARDILAEAQRQASRFINSTEGKPATTRASLPPRYHNPADHNQTWSGMGRQPQWYREYIARGGNEQDLLI
ncbi:MAG: H-NS histone family protein [Cardiobacteriaceae bacterium]|nr:H-NS histone family protein [Cardiobacteriaceae bacterium]